VSTRRTIVAAVSIVTERFAAHSDCPLDRVVVVVRDAEARSTFERSIEEA
jgi:hypothetical protein